LLKRVAGQPNFKVVNDAGHGAEQEPDAIEESALSDQEPEQSGSAELSDPAEQQTRGAGWCVGSAEAAPTAQSYAVYDEVVTQIDAQLQKLAQIMRTDVPAFNQLVRDQNIPAVVVKPAGVKSVGQSSVRNRIYRNFPGEWSVPQSC
jgi:hypothetical protein